MLNKNYNLPKEGPKIILVANSAWYIHNFRMGLIQALQKKGYRIYVATPVDDFINFIYDDDSIKFIPLKHLIRKSINVFKDYKFYKELKGIYKKIQPDVVLHFTVKPNVYGTQAAKSCLIKSLVVIPGLGYTFTEESGYRNIIQEIYRRVLPYNDKVIFENKSDREYFVKHKIIPESKSIAFKGCGVDTAFFKPMEKIKTDDKTTRFLFMGRLIKEKGIYEFIKAAEKVFLKNHKTEFWIIGHIDADNPSAISHETFVKWIEHPAIKYLGFSHDVRQIIRNVDCVVLPSYYPEGVPRVLQEGMAMEKPIITADCDGCREAVDDGINGYLVQPADIGSLAESFLKIINMSKEDRELMGKEGRKKAVTEFKESISIELYLNIIEASLNKKPVGKAS